jgi:hypothetical protein
MDVIYYYTFLFYSKIFKDDEPHIKTIWGISFLEGFATNIFLEIFSMHFLNFRINLFIKFIIILIILLINYLYFIRSKRFKKILKVKPFFFNNHRLTIILVAFIAITFISILFLGGIWIKFILKE